MTKNKLLEGRLPPPDKGVNDARPGSPTPTVRKPVAWARTTYVTGVSRHLASRNHKLSLSESSLESLRHSYRPSEIILLLVGESPPPHKGFFYDATAIEGPLSRSTRRSFEDFFGTKYSDRQDFLRQFKSKGCYLLDLFGDRGKTVYGASERERETALKAK
jgi:hypothetical protein